MSGLTIAMFRFAISNRIFFAFVFAMVSLVLIGFGQGQGNLRQGRDRDAGAHLGQLRARTRGGA